MGDFGQRVGLIHELRELRRPEELPDGCCRRLGIDQIVRHDRIDLDRTHALADRPFHAQQADTVLIFHQFADRANPAVAEVIDVVDLTPTVLELDEHLDDRQNVCFAQSPYTVVGIERQARIHLDPADCR